jgi:hypothetical protein
MLLQVAFYTSKEIDFIISDSKDTVLPSTVDPDQSQTPLIS